MPNRPFPRKSKLRGRLARLAAREKAFQEDSKISYGGIGAMMHKPGSMKK